MCNAFGTLHIVDVFHLIAQTGLNILAHGIAMGTYNGKRYKSPENGPISIYHP